MRHEMRMGVDDCQSPPSSARVTNAAQIHQHVLRFGRVLQQLMKSRFRSLEISTSERDCPYRRRSTQRGAAGGRPTCCSARCWRCTGWTCGGTSSGQPPRSPSGASRMFAKPALCCRLLECLLLK